MVKEVVLLFPKGKTAAWSDSAAAEYVKKINPFIKFSIQELKSKGADRDSAELKKEAEAEAIRKFLQPGDNLLALTEKGKVFSDSREFAKTWARTLETGSGRLVVLIGGPYGIHESILEKSKIKVSLSGMTFNHHVAKVVALEQIYRAFTLLKGIPYHND